MKIINLGRGQGKTTRLLYASEFNNIPILCRNYASRDYLVDKAQRLGLHIPEPVILDQITSKKIAGSELVDKDMFVDDADWVLQGLLNYLGMKGTVKAVTLTSDEQLEV